MNDFGCWHPRVCLRPVSYLAFLHADKALATSVVIRGGFQIHHRERPNKAPEPTPTSVTPRALSGVSTMKQQNEARLAARVAPAVVVAHL